MADPSSSIGGSLNKFYVIVDQDLLWINKEHLTRLPYFDVVFATPEIYGTGSIYDPVRLDFNMKDIESIVDYLRNGDQYQLKDEESYIWNQLMDPIFVPKKSDFLEITIGNAVIFTTAQTLCHLNYFHAMVNVFKSPLPKILDRNGMIFKILLAKLRNPICDFPKEYNYELTFFGGFKDNSSEVADSQSELIKMTIPILSHDKTTIQDCEADLTDNPQITFHKVIFRRFIYFETGNVIVDGIQDKNIIIFNIPKENIDYITGDMYIFFDVPAGNPNISPSINRLELRCSSHTLNSISNKLNNIIGDLFYVKDNIMQYQNNITKNHTEKKYIEPYFFNKYVDGLSIPNCVLACDVITVRLVLHEPIKLNTKLCLEYNNVYQEERVRIGRMDYEYLITEWKEVTINFDKNKFTIEMTMHGCFDMILFEIESESESEISPGDDLLIDTALCFGKNIKKYINPFISARSFEKVSADVKHHPNIYFMYFGRSRKFNDTQPSGYLNIRPDYDTNFKFNLNCTKGKIHIYAHTYNITKTDRGFKNKIYDHHMKITDKIAN